MRQSESVRRANVLWMKSGRISDESFGALSGFYKLGSARCQLQACRQTGRFASRELANATHCKVPTLSVKFPRLLSIHATAAAISTLSGSGPDRKSAHELLDLSSLSFGAAEFGLMRTGLMHGLHRLDQEARLMAVVRLCELAQERFFGCAGNIANGKHAEDLGAAFNLLVVSNEALAVYEGEGGSHGKDVHRSARVRLKGLGLSDHQPLDRMVESSAEGLLGDGHPERLAQMRRDRWAEVAFGVEYRTSHRGIGPLLDGGGARALKSYLASLSPTRVLEFAIECVEQEAKELHQLCSPWQANSSNQGPGDYGAPPNTMTMRKKLLWLDGLVTVTCQALGRVGSAPLPQLVAARKRKLQAIEKLDSAVGRVGSRIEGYSGKSVRSDYEAISGRLRNAVEEHSGSGLGS